jgi:ubiquinone biosynthesis protein Coq4
MMELGTPESMAAMGRRFASAPDLAPAFAERHLPPAYTVEEAVGFRRGTFGHAWYRFMKDNGLSVDYLPPREPNSDLGWFRARMGQMHDQWHVLLGISADAPGEIEIIAFMLAQFRKSLPRERLALSFNAAMLAAYLANTVRYRPSLLTTCLRALARGYRRGFQVPPLWAVHFEELWPLPLLEVQAAHGAVPPPC